MSRLLVLITFVFFNGIAHADRPNILWLSAEDISPNLGCYGDEHARTPNLDRLAAEGILYENAFSTAPVCAPSRSAIITGVYATSLGTHHMRSQVTLPPEIRCFSAYLRDAGYYCTNNSKEDYNFRTPQGSWDQSNGKAHWRNRPDPEQPFFAVFNYTGTHESHIRGDEPAYSKAIAKLKPEELHDPASLKLPPYYPETPKVRSEWARYYNLVTAFDHWVAKHLKELEDAGLADNTIVMFWSDHGVGMPRGKRWLYDSGIHVPLIVRLPERYRSFARTPSGKQTDELVSLVDLAPTVLNLAGQPIPTYMQGRAFLGENLTPEREYIFAARDRMDERYDMSRVVRTKRYAYIRNFMPWRPYAQWLSYAEQSPTMQELRRLKAEGKLTQEQLAFLADRKPVEELYDLQNDPYELSNLADHRGFQKLNEAMTGRLLDQMESSLDLGILPETSLNDELAPRFPWYTRFRQRYTRPEYVELLHGADFISKELIGMPTDGEVVVGILMSKQFDNKNALAGASWWGRGATLVDATGLCPTTQIAADEFSIANLPDRRATAIASAIDHYEHADSPWDQLQAANVLDLIPNFDEHADEIRPVVERVHKKLKTKRNPTQAEGYILRCTERLRERLHRSS